jgi:hypothetical protein
VATATAAGTAAGMCGGSATPINIQQPAYRIVVVMEVGRGPDLALASLPRGAVAMVSLCWLLESTTPQSGARSRCTSVLAKLILAIITTVAL